MSGKTRVGKGGATAPGQGKSRARRDGGRLTLAAVTAVSTCVASVLAALAALADALHHLLAWLLHVL